MLNKMREDAQSVPMNIEFKLKHELCTIEDQEEVLTLDDSWSAYWFAFNIPGANKEKCQEVVCKSPGWSYSFALNIPGANIDKCQEVACQDSYWAYLFALYIPGANIEKCQEAACENPYYAYLFAQNVPGADKKKIRKFLIGTEYEGKI